MKLRLLAAGGVLAMLAASLPVRASLGGDYASVEADRAKMQASLQSTSTDSYAVHQLQAPTGVGVKEYVSSAGNVFAVTWQGPVPPDLQQLLGSYYSQYIEAVRAERAQRHGHGPVNIQQSGFVVQIAGHARSFWGRVYLPQTLPSGVQAKDLR